MRYGSLEYYQENADYWHKQYTEANKRAGAAIAEAKKSKQREKSAIRLMLKFKKQASQFESLLRRVSGVYACADTVKGFNKGIYEVIQEFKNG